MHPVGRIHGSPGRTDRTAASGLRGVPRDGPFCLGGGDEGGDLLAGDQSPSFADDGAVGQEHGEQASGDDLIHPDEQWEQWEDASWDEEDERPLLQQVGMGGIILPIREEGAALPATENLDEFLLEHERTASGAQRQQQPTQRMKRRLITGCERRRKMHMETAEPSPEPEERRGTHNHVEVHIVNNGIDSRGSELSINWTWEKIALVVVATWLLGAWLSNSFQQDPLSHAGVSTAAKAPDINHTDAEAHESLMASPQQERSVGVWSLDRLMTIVDAGTLLTKLGQMAQKGIHLIPWLVFK